MSCTDVIALFASLAVAVLAGWNLHTVYETNRYYRLKNFLEVWLSRLTMSNITDFDLDKLRNQLQKEENHHGKK